jgi:hypothetical protein
MSEESSLLMEGWGYNNGSMETSERGVSNGRPRKVALGAFFLEIEPPIVNGAWVEFKAA